MVRPRDQEERERLEKQERERREEEERKRWVRERERVEHVDDDRTGGTGPRGPAAREN